MTSTPTTGGLSEAEFRSTLQDVRAGKAKAALASPATGTGITPATGTCRAACGVPLSAALIDDAADNSGLHANCTEPQPPPSTIIDMESALYRYDSSRERSIQTRLGPSELGTPCARQIALKIAGAPQKDRGLAWAPLCGTAVHSLMENVLRMENQVLGEERYSIETALDIGEGITGHGDAYDSRHGGVVIDWKYTGVTARRKASRRSVPNSQLVSQEYRVQTHLYGKGHINAGRPVKWVRVVMLARSHDYGESREWTEAYRPDIADRALARYTQLAEKVGEAQIPITAAASVTASPSLDTCKWCPFWQPSLSEAGAQGCPGYQGSNRF